MNIILILIELIISLLTVFILYKKVKQEGLTIMLIIMSILQYILSFNELTIYNIPISNGLLISTIIFIIMNIITQTKGKEESFHSLWIVWLSFIVSFIIITISSFSTSIYLESYNQMFSHGLKLFSSLTIATIISLIVNINLYYFLRRIKNKIWISNIISGIISQFIECIIFIFLYYIGNHNIETIILIILISIIIKIITIVVSVIPIYIITRRKR